MQQSQGVGPETFLCEADGGQKCHQFKIVRGGGLRAAISRTQECKWDE